jgi:formylglycine-generating enzyme required for sulfatase activity
MHNETLLYSRQTHAYPAPLGLAALKPLPASEWLNFSGGRFRQGQKSEGKIFVFDNEKPEHWVEVPAFQLSSTPVRQSEFLAFMDK